jgi:hypothetical protein
MIGRIRTEILQHLMVAHLQAVAVVRDGGFRTISADAGDKNISG